MRYLAFRLTRETGAYREVTRRDRPGKNWRALIWRNQHIGDLFSTSPRSLLILNGFSVQKYNLNYADSIANLNFVAEYDCELQNEF